MLSERDGWRRLHPYTLIFALGRHAYASRAVLVPVLVALGLSQRRGTTGGWQDFQEWLLLPVPALLVYELVQYVTLAYRFSEHDIVVTRGLYWKRERHIPYARVQNIELVQHWGHRLAGVAKVRLDTGTGADPDAELAVLSLEAVQQLRDAVREGRRGPEPAGAEPAERAPEVVAALGLRELALHGLLTGRGIVVIAAMAGALWQIDMDGWEVGRFLPSFKGMWRGVETATPRLMVELAVLGLSVVLIFRLLSAAWSVVKHFDFSLTVRGAELFQSYGLLTRVGRTIPRARIQKLTITDNPLMRRLGRATVSVDTAASVGGQATQSALGGSQVLVPILPWARVPALVREVHPTGTIADLHDLDGLDWQGVDDRTFSRLVRVRVAFATAVGIGLWFAIGWWALLAAGVLGTLLGLQAFVSARFTAFAWSGETLVFRTSNGWTRQISLVRSARMQVVSVRQSPLDRRWGMKQVHVDTAGAAGGGHQMDIPWLTGSVADALYARLRHAAVTT